MDFEFLSHLNVVLGIIGSLLSIAAAVIFIWQSSIA
jgi:hypothetical protein